MAPQLGLRSFVRRRGRAASASPPLLLLQLVVAVAVLLPYTVVACSAFLLQPPCWRRRPSTVGSEVTEAAGRRLHCIILHATAGGEASSEQEVPPSTRRPGAKPPPRSKAKRSKPAPRRQSSSVQPAEDLSDSSASNPASWAAERPLPEVCGELDRLAALGQIRLTKELYHDLLHSVEDAQCRAENAVLKAYLNAAKYGPGKAWYLKMLKKRVAPDEESMDKLLRAAARSGNGTAEVEEVFKRASAAFPDRENKAAWWAMLVEGYAKRGMWRSADKIVRERMPQVGVEPDLRTYTALMAAHAKANRSEDVSKVLQEMQQARVVPDEETKAVLMESLVRNGEATAALKLMKEMEGEGASLNIAHYNTILTGLVDDARTQTHKRHRAAILLEEMMSSGIEPTNATYASVVAVFAAAGDMTGALDQLAKMKDLGVIPSAIQCNLAMKVLADSGATEEAELWLKKMQSADIQPTVMTYNALMTGYARKAKTQECVELLREMRHHKVKPNIASHNCIVKAHAEAGNFSGVLEWLDAMPGMHARPNVKTYNSIFSSPVSEMDDRGSGVNVTDFAEELLRRMISSSVQPRGQSKRGLLNALGKERYRELAAPPPPTAQQGQGK